MNMKIHKQRKPLLNTAAVMHKAVQPLAPQGLAHQQHCPSAHSFHVMSQVCLTGKKSNLHLLLKYPSFFLQYCCCILHYYCPAPLDSHNPLAQFSTVCEAAQTNTHASSSWLPGSHSSDITANYEWASLVFHGLHFLSCRNQL